MPQGEFKDNQPEIPTVKGTTLQGGPQMIQLRCANLGVVFLA